MFEKAMNAIWAEFRGQAAKNAVERIAPFHRLAASPGYRDANRVCRDWLKDAGIPSRVHSYPADGKTEYWSFIAGTEWDATEGTLHLLEPAAEARTLADWDAFNMALMSGSANADVTAPLAVIEDHWKEADYKAAKLKGKIVLTRDVGAARRLAVEKFGAAGIISDWFRRLRHVRETGDLTDVLHMQGLGGAGGKKTFGFVVSPREGMHLRKLVAASTKPILLKARVRAKRYKGSYEVLSATIPGTSKEEVLLLAHLCHAQWCANDNASGCAACMEILRTLKTLIDRKVLAKPKRTIRVLLVPEYAGSYIYLARNPGIVKNAIAGINLDMVGEDQELCKTSFCCERPPAAAGSFIGDLAEAIQWALPQGGVTPSSTDRFPLIRQCTTEFSGWSDHDVLSDPTVGIPSPMLIQWPDLFYHTTGDTIDKVDPASLHRAGSLGATYAYFLATAGEPEAKWIAAHVLGRFKERIVGAGKQAAKDALTGGPAGTQRALEARLAYLMDLGCRALASVKTLAEIDVEPMANTLRAFARSEFAGVRDELPKGRAPRRNKAQREAEVEAETLIPIRLYKGPLALGRQLRKLSKAKREAWNTFNKQRTGIRGLRLTPRIAQFWADGSRTILEIADCLEQDTGGERDVEYLVRYFKLLADLKLARIEKTG